MRVTDSGAFRAVEDHRGDDIVVGVLGTADAGVDEFIRLLTGTDLPYSPEARQDVETYRIIDHKDLGDRVVLLKAPTVDEVDKNEPRILSKIERWLKKMYPSRTHKGGFKPLRALFYLRPMAHYGYQGSPVRNLTKYMSICGDSCMARVRLIVTNFTASEAHAQEELESGFGEFWRCATSLASRAPQFLKPDVNQNEIWDIVNQLTENAREAEYESLGEEWAKLQNELAKKNDVGRQIRGFITTTLDDLSKYRENREEMAIRFPRAQEFFRSLNESLNIMNIRSGERFIDFLTRPAFKILEASLKKIRYAYRASLITLAPKIIHPRRIDFDFSEDASESHPPA